MTLIPHWPFWISVAALAGFALVHWFVLRRMLTVSGRFTAIVDRARGWTPAAEEPMSEAELLAALRAATIEEFGTAALDGSVSAAAAPPAGQPTRAAVRQPLGAHAIFLGGLGLGGLVSALLAGALEVGPGLRSQGFTQIFGSSGATQALVLAFGGMLVGFGTRMASGCTSGHGLCGVSRGQPGSLAATLAFFGAGIVVSLLLGSLW